MHIQDMGLGARGWLHDRPLIHTIWASPFDTRHKLLPRKDTTKREAQVKPESGWCINLPSFTLACDGSSLLVRWDNAAVLGP